MHELLFHRQKALDDEDLRTYARELGLDLTSFEQDYAAMNAVYRSYFPPARLPARTCIGVTALARGALVEIDCIARRPGAAA